MTAVTFAKQLIDEGKLGRVFHYRAKFLQDWTINPELPLAYFNTPALYQAATGYPHIVRTQDALTYTIAGTWAEEIWPTPPGQTDREVRFHPLSDGGHAWPGAFDRVGWDAQLGVMDFFDAH